ncbi:hypothetical protein CK203_034757 [Vitis vinifera]|uniref:Uncharacterized protein n=1 Tax=Vitis vinifera TaxID=29760 RepID=A0A438IC47_VITVI|nr:hypothetical protein CK203_034757 [Vitis vinifera]
MDFHPWASRAITVVSFRLLEPSLSSRFPSHPCHLIQASRAITIVSFGLPEPSLSSRLGFPSHPCHLIQASRAITIVSFELLELSLSSRLGFQSHHCRLIQASRAITIVSFGLPEPSLSLAFRVSFLAWLPEPSFFLSLVFRVGLVIQSHNSWRPYPLALRILPSWFYIVLRFFSLRYLVLIAYSSRSPHRVVPFGRILARTPGWFDRYSSLTLIS